MLPHALQQKKRTTSNGFLFFFYSYFLQIRRRKPQTTKKCSTRSTLLLNAPPYAGRYSNVVGGSYINFTGCVCVCGDRKFRKNKTGKFLSVTYKIQTKFYQRTRRGKSTWNKKTKKKKSNKNKKYLWERQVSTSTNIYYL